MKQRHVGRRGFLQTSAAGAAAAAFGATNAPAQASTTRLVWVKNANATDEQGEGRADAVRAMVERSVCELTGKSTLADAWRELVSPDDIVGIKLNLRGGRYLSSQPCVIDAIVAGLKAAGVKENNIIAWEAFTREFGTAGYTINKSDRGVRYIATDEAYLEGERPKTKSAAEEARRNAHQSEPVKVADKEVHFSRILTDEITALINVPLIKDHVIAGVTCSMKNHYGSILVPRDLHGNHCDPYLADLNAQPPIKDKTRLILVDGLRSLYNGGPRDKPQWRWRQNSILAGTDTVAVDSLVLRILEEKREEVGMEPVAPRAHHLETAAKMGLGTNDLSKVDLREIDLTSA
jgi:uncharacterized protein (DUF362 family)